MLYSLFLNLITKKEIKYVIKYCNDGKKRRKVSR